jgi:hypothetical protein
MVTSESHRISDQLRRAFSGDPWHGPPLRDLLAGLTAEQACQRPLASAHSIWELVFHIETWVNAALEATRGTAMPQWPGTPNDWPSTAEAAAPEWTAATARLFDVAERLAKAIAGFSDTELEAPVAGRSYNFYHLFHGVVQHSLYHAGQIALLRRAVAPSA